MLSKIRKVVLPLVFCLSLWHIASTIVNNSFMLPGIKKTLKALLVLLAEESFYKAIFFSAVRVTFGLILGCIVGLLLAVICDRVLLIKEIISPVITVIRSTPVASFIVILWLMMSGEKLSVFIGFIMVLPIIWQSTTDAISSVDKSLVEVTQVYEFSFLKKFRLLILPTMRKFLFPAIITSSGLAWKAEIAAEIMVYTKKSIGQGINDAKYIMDTATVFAWTIVIIFLSIILESVTRFLLKRSKNGT